MLRPSSHGVEQRRNLRDSRGLRGRLYAEDVHAGLSFLSLVGSEDICCRLESAIAGNDCTMRLSLAVVIAVVDLGLKGHRLLSFVPESLQGLRQERYSNPSNDIKIIFLSSATLQR